MRKKTAKLHELQPHLKTDLAENIPTQDNFFRIKHSINIGDLWGAMGALKKYHDITNRKVVLSQATDRIAQYYTGAEHPTKNAQGQPVCMNDEMWEMCRPLVEIQPYIYKFEKYNGQKVDLDFDVIRGKTFVNLPNGHLAGWLPLAFPDLHFSISTPWITVDGECPEHIKKQISRKVILNFTERYRNAIMDYYFLQNYSPDLIFAGTEKEHFLFCQRWGLNIPRLEISNFLELAYALKESRFLYCNQSQALNLSQAMGTTHAFEICSFAQNIMHMINDKSFGWLHQVGAEYLFRRLYNETFGK